MNNSKLIIILAITTLIILLMVMVIKTLTIQGFSISEQKCSSLAGNNADNCWHSLGHQTFNGEFCNKIIDNETREHCFEHIGE